MLAKRARRDLLHLANKYGNTVTVYNPTKTYNDEGDPTYNLGSGVEAKILVFPVDEEIMAWQPEGINISTSFRCYIPYDVNIQRDSVIKYGSDYYILYSFASIKIDNQTVFYDVVMTKTDIHQ